MNVYDKLIEASLQDESTYPANGTAGLIKYNSVDRKVFVYNSRIAGDYQKLANESDVDAVESELMLRVPTGSTIMWPLETAPSGWLILDGKTIGKDSSSGADVVGDDLENLFELLKTSWGNSGKTWGAIGDAGKVTLPDTKGRFPRGWNSTSSGIDASRSFGTYQTDLNKSHTHSYNRTTVQVGAGTITTGTTSETSSVSSTTGADGGAESRPYNFSINFIIKV